MWYTDEANANLLRKAIETGIKYNAINLDYILALWTDWKNFENKTFFKVAA
jgi:hypothetical protein